MSDTLGFSKERLSTSKKCWLWLVPIGIALIYLNPAAIIFLPLFPNGLSGWLRMDDQGSMLLCVFGWIFYIGITVMGLRAKTRWGYFLFYGAFCVVLALNSVGCRRILYDVSHVH